MYVRINSNKCKVDWDIRNNFLVISLSIPQPIQENIITTQFQMILIVSSVTFFCVFVFVSSPHAIFQFTIYLCICAIFNHKYSLFFFFFASMKVSRFKNCDF